MAENFNKNLGLRLKQVREKLGLTLEEVAEKMGFNNYQTLLSIEDGSRQIKAYEIAQLAKFYYRDISYFLNPSEKQETESLVLWRDRSNDDRVKIKQQEFLKYCYNYYDLEELLGLDHRFNLHQLTDLTADDLTYTHVEDIANRYYNEMKLGSRPACILGKVLEETYNIKTLYLNLEHYGSAASTIGKFGAAILLNSSEPPWRINYNLAHELFHIITWNIFKSEECHYSTNDEKSFPEKLADLFASCLLLPRDEVTIEFKKRVENNKIAILDLIGIAREFVVSTEALLWRLVALNCLQKETVKDLLDNPHIKELDRIKRSEDWVAPPYISVRYVNFAFKVFQKGMISRGKLSEYLNIDRADLKDKLSEYGYNEENIYDAEIAIA